MKLEKNPADPPPAATASERPALWMIAGDAPPYRERRRPCPDCGAPIARDEAYCPSCWTERIARWTTGMRPPPPSSPSV